MAKDDLTGNMPTEIMLDWFKESEIETGIDWKVLDKAMNFAPVIFG